MVKKKEKINNSDERYRKMFETSMDAIMILEPPTWSFTSANPATVRLFGAKNEKEFIALGPGDASPKKQPNGRLSSSEAKKMIGEALKTGSNFFEWTHKKVDGHEFPVTVLLTRMEVNGKKILQATVRDVSNQKKIEEELRKKIQEMEKVNKMMIGRELKMVELKEKIRKLEKGVKSESVEKTWPEKFQDAIDLEEGVIEDLGAVFLRSIEESNLNFLKKKKIKRILKVLINESKIHRQLFEQLIEDSQ